MLLPTVDTGVTHVAATPPGAAEGRAEARDTHRTTGVPANLQEQQRVVGGNTTAPRTAATANRSRRQYSYLLAGPYKSYPRLLMSTQHRTTAGPPPAQAVRTDRADGGGKNRGKPEDAPARGRDAQAHGQRRRTTSARHSSARRGLPAAVPAVQRRSGARSPKPARTYMPTPVIVAKGGQPTCAGQPPRGVGEEEADALVSAAVGRVLARTLGRALALVWIRNTRCRCGST